MVLNAACDSARRREKWAAEEMLGTNQYPSHLSLGERGKIWLSRATEGGRGVEGGSL